MDDLKGPFSDVYYDEDGSTATVYTGNGERLRFIFVEHCAVPHWNVTRESDSYYVNERGMR
jgi:hypothetical protein